MVSVRLIRGMHAPRRWEMLEVLLLLHSSDQVLRACEAELNIK